MQIHSLSLLAGTNAISLGTGQVEGSTRLNEGPSPTASTAQPSQTTAAAPATPLPAGLRVGAPQLNQQCGRGQQALRYLAQLDAQLASLKRTLSAEVSQPATATSPTLADKLAGVQSLWQQRQQASGGGLDSQLRFQPDGLSQQGFQLRGLDAQALQRPEKETLSFTTGSDQPDRRIVSAVLDADQPLEARVQKLDQALAPANIRVKLDAQGQVKLHTAEANWPAVQTGLGVRGSGVRFPASQFHRVKLDADTSALRPDTWRVDDNQACRQTLQEIVQAQQLVKRSQAQVTQTLSKLADTLDASQPAMVDGQWAQRFATDFARIGQQPANTLIGAIGPALTGISRERVDRLLA